jgi:hypothetical protein
MLSYLSSFIWKTDEQVFSTFEKNLQVQKMKLRKSIMPFPARNLPKHITLNQVPRQEMNEILTIKLRKTIPHPRQTVFVHRHPVLRQLIETRKKINTF